MPVAIELPPTSAKKVFASMIDQCFPDGYCHCRCGPEHHVGESMGFPAWIYCRNPHHGTCYRVNAPASTAHVIELVSRLTAEGI
jgi:hypothetical protein